MSAQSLTKMATEVIGAAAKQRNMLKKALPFLRDSVTWRPNDTNWTALSDPQYRLEVYLY